jgi:hypothetical protein
MLLPMNARLRLAATCLVLATASAAVSGCGGSGPSVAHSATVSPSPPITKAKATAYARAVNLRAGDLPLASVFEPEGEGREHRYSRLAACERGADDVSPAHPIINRRSATLGWSLPGEFERFYSAVEVLPTAALTDRHNAANRSRRTLVCASRYLRSLFARGSAGRLEFGPVIVTRLPDPLPGVDGSFGYRIVTTVTAGGMAAREMVDYTTQQVKPIRLYFDLFGFIAGPAEINLTTMGTRQSVSKKVEDQLLVLLYGRAKAHRL